MLQIADTQSASESTVSARAIAADIMGVSSAYVGRAQQPERDAQRSRVLPLQTAGQTPPRSAELRKTGCPEGHR